MWGWLAAALSLSTAYRDSCPQYFANPKLVALLQEAEVPPTDVLL